MDHKHLSEINERLIRSEVAAEWRHREVVTRLAMLELPRSQQSLNGTGSGWGPWVKVPLALLLPLLAFLLTLAITGDPRAALNAARVSG